MIIFQLALFIKIFFLFCRYKNILLILFSFEFLVLNIFLIYVMSSTPYEYSGLLMFLAVAASEASIGLSLLVSMVRQSGSDKVGLSLKCEGY